MLRRPSGASRFPRAHAVAIGAALLLMGWIGCEVDRSGLGILPPVGQAGAGGQLSTPLGTGGHVAVATGGSASIHFGTGGATVEEGGQSSGGAIGTGGVALASGGGSGGTAATGSGGAAGGQGAGSPGSGGAGHPPASGGGGAIGGAAGGAPVGRGGASATAGTNGGGGVSGRGGATGTGGGRWGSGGAGDGLPMCDPSIRDGGPCSSGSADCGKTCGVSSLATKPCTCVARQWSCGTCVYPSGNYSCYRLPVAMSVPPCPFGTVNGVTACLANCSLCSGYIDTGVMSKIGYCACTQDPGDIGRVYHCASTAEWPPQ